MPEVKEIMFDDDTFTDTPTCRASRRSRAGMGKLGMTWTCNAKANVPYKTLKVMKDNGLRLLLVGYESGDDQILHNIKKGLRTDIARRFTEDCRKLGIVIHGTFILGLPGETTETIQKTIEFAKEINPHTIQVSLAAPYPGTTLYKQAVENGWLERERGGQPGQRSGRAARRASAIRICRRRRSSTAWKCSTSASISGRSKIWEIVREMLAQLGHDEAASARRRRVLPLPARARGLSDWAATAATPRGRLMPCLHALLAAPRAAGCRRRGAAIPR